MAQEVDEAAAPRSHAASVTELGFKGAMANCFAQKEVADSALYYDQPEYRQRSGRRGGRALDGSRSICITGLEGLEPIAGAVPKEASLGCTARPGISASETATQALRHDRLGQLFDRVHRLQVVLGHLGERIPFDMWRASTT